MSSSTNIPVSTMHLRQTPAITSVPSMQVGWETKLENSNCYTRRALFTPHILHETHRIPGILVALVDGEYSLLLTTGLFSPVMRM